MTGADLEQLLLVGFVSGLGSAFANFLVYEWFLSKAKKFFVKKQEEEA